MNIVRKIRDYVEQECKKPTSKYGYEPFVFHFVPVANYAKKLANKLGGNKEVIMLAVWLHDIGSIIRGRNNHHIAGAKIAEKKLRELNYPEEKIKLIKKCILHHRGSQNLKRKTLEEKIVAEADVLSQFDNIAGIFKAAFVYENLDQGAAKISVRKKLQRKYKQLNFASSKKIIKPKYEAAMIILK
jgi:putative nucleotidyltransferase with HDIG domain